MAEEANSFIFRCIAACLICHQSGGKYFWEHPQDLGEVHSEHPASIWQWPEMRDLLVQTNATTFAIQQCHFGADTPKPTRFLTTLSTDDSIGVILVGPSSLQMHIVDHFRSHVVMYINRNSLGNRMGNGELVQVRLTHQDFVNLSPSCVSLPPLWSEGVRTTHLFPLHLRWRHLLLPPWLGRTTHPVLRLGLAGNSIHAQSLLQLVLQRAHPLVLQ